MAVHVNGAEIALTGVVGDTYWDDGFTAAEVIAALAEVGRDTDITVRLNSGGGIATEGAAIHAALAAHKGTVAMVVEGIAASAASVIAMAGDTITMSPGAVLMIHDPATQTWGDAAAHAKTIAALDKLGDAYAGIYADRTGKTVADMRALMRAETWMTADDAVAAGFADRLAATNDNDQPTAFAYGVYAKAPQRIVALANARGWKAPRATMAALPAALPRHDQEISMTDTPSAGTPPAAPATEDTPPATPPAAEPTADTAVDAVAIIDLCNAAGVPEMASALVRDRVSVAEATARVRDHGEVKKLLAHGQKINAAAFNAEFTASLEAMSVEQARAAIVNRLADSQSPEISAANPVADTPAPGGGWKAVVAKLSK